MIKQGLQIWSRRVSNRSPVCVSIAHFLKELKLLRPGKTYPLGRKQKHPLQLVLSHPKISGEHLTFVVGNFPVDSVVSPLNNFVPIPSETVSQNDTTFRPTLKIQNHRTKPLQVSRTINGSVTRHTIQATSEDEVSPGDCIALVTGIYITLRNNIVLHVLHLLTFEIAFIGVPSAVSYLRSPHRYPSRSALR